MMNNTHNFEILNKLFRKNFISRMKLRELVSSLSNLEKNMCLEITTDTPVLSYYLRKTGGKWHTAIPGEDKQALFMKCLEENVHVFNEQELPFKKNSFDVIILIDILERVKSDAEFIEQCHKLLKPEGHLIVHARQVKTHSLLNLLRHLLGIKDSEFVRAGYTESELFKVLRDGFNVREVRTYSRFFVEMVDIIAGAIVERKSRRGNMDSSRLLRLYTILNIFYWIAAQFDFCLFFTKGNYLIATAQRRAWRPRRAPVLADGRSIVDAVLSKPGG